MEFDITDGRNRYAPCPGCGGVACAGMGGGNGMTAVFCTVCGHRGPEFLNSADSDRLAFEAWWAESSATFKALLAGAALAKKK